MKKQPCHDNGESVLQHEIDALVEFVHRGCGPMLDVLEVLQVVSPALQPNCSANYEYRFAWNDDCDPETLDIDWKRPKKRILQRAVRNQERLGKILAGAKMTAADKRKYRLELARSEHGYKTARERLESNDNCKWVDLSYVTDSQGRTIYLMEMGDAVVGDDEDLDTVIDLHEAIWGWKQGPLSIFGPFRSEEEAKEWMAENGAFDDE